MTDTQRLRLLILHKLKDMKIPLDNSYAIEHNVSGDYIPASINYELEHIDEMVLINDVDGLINLYKGLKE